MTGENIDSWEERLSRSKKNISPVKAYRRQGKWKDFDPIIDHISPTVFSKWINACNSQRDDKFTTCPLCKEKDSALHAYCECEKLGAFSQSLTKSLDTKLHVMERKQHIIDFMYVLQMREKGGNPPPKIPDNGSGGTTQLSDKNARALGIVQKKNEVHPLPPRLHSRSREFMGTNSAQNNTT